jgi:acetyltransferase-like isoleucine patch superfamily enzyme
VAPVIVHKNAWIAINVTILPGVEIGEGSIVSAGSVVSKSIPPFTVASGNPAKVVADIAELVRKNYTPEDFERLLQERKKKYKI